MAVKTYDPANVLINYGPVVITGYAPDTFASIEYNSEFYSVQIGADGKSNTRSKNNDRSARITLTLMQTSPTNDLLSAQHAKDELSGNNPQPMQVKDLATGATFVAETAWIVSTPNSEFAQEAGGWEWVFETDELVPVYGDPAFRTLP